MVATTRSRSPAQTHVARRSFTDEWSSLQVENAPGRERRHSVVAAFAVPAPALPASPTELRSPRSLKEYEAELQQSKVRCEERTKRPSEPFADVDQLPRKLLQSHRPSSMTPRRSLSQSSRYTLEIIGPHYEGITPLLSDVLEGFHAHVAPVPVDDGAGGVYFLRNKAQRIVAVFKPADEEPFAINNPKEHRPRLNSRAECGNNTDDGNDAPAAAPEQTFGIRGGIAPGVAAIREVAAYLLDHGHRAGVPPTVLVTAQHPAFFVRRKATTTLPRKVGSLQLYAPHDSTADDVSESVFPVERVHAMAILDMRLANQDRHGGNVLVVGSPTSRRYDLVPIDHGACLPRITSMEETSFLWHSWPQAKVPFDGDAKAQMASFDGVRDAELLLAKLPAPYQVEPEALLTLAVCTVLLQVCVLKFDMTAYDTASLMCRQDPSEPSVLEQIVSASMAEKKQWGAWSRSDADDLTQSFRRRLEAFLSGSSAI